MPRTSVRSSGPGTDTVLDDVTRLLSALAEPTRLRLLALLHTGDHCVCDLHESLAITSPSASHHLALLRHAGLVTRRRDRYWVHYQLATDGPVAFRSVLDSIERWVAASPEGQRDRQRLESLKTCCRHAAASRLAEERRPLQRTPLRLPRSPLRKGSHDARQ